MTTLSVQEVADRYGVGTRTVLLWIKSGELRATDCSRRAGAKKPRWRVSQAALDEFERLRSASPPPAPVRRRRAEDAGVIRFFS